MIEDFVKKEFPYALVLRMDADSTKKQEDYETILSRFANREADILIGTQMIVKGHDFNKNKYSNEVINDSYGRNIEICK